MTTVLVYVGVGLILVAVLGFGALLWLFSRPDPWEQKW